MNSAPVPAGAARGNGTRPGKRERLLAMPRALALYGLSLAGAALLTLAAAPVVLAALGLGHFTDNALRHGLPDAVRQGLSLGGENARDLLGAAIGLAGCWLVLPAALLATRRLAMLTRRLSAQWCGVPPSFTDEGLRAALRARAELARLPILVLSQYVEQLYARELLADGAGAVGYLLKDRVLDGAQFTDAVKRVADGGTAMDPEVIARLLAHSATSQGPLGRLSPREREVLALMAEGRSNAAIAARLVVTERAVAKHTAAIFTKLDLQPSDDDNRRVLAVLAYLGR